MMFETRVGLRHVRGVQPNKLQGAGQFRTIKILYCYLNDFDVQIMVGLQSKTDRPNNATRYVLRAYTCTKQQNATAARAPPSTLLHGGDYSAPLGP